MLHRKSEYALRNMLLLWSDYTLDDMVRMLKHSDQRVDDTTMRARCAAAVTDAVARRDHSRASRARVCNAMPHPL